MKEGTKARAATIYLDEADRWHGRPLYLVILDRLRAEGFPGVTVLRGVAGFGSHGQVHTASIVDLGANLPILIQVIDTPERIDLVLPLLDELVPEGLITLHDVEIARLRRKESAPVRATVARDLMTREFVLVPAATPVPELAGILARNKGKGVYVVDPGGALLGVVTENDLLRRGLDLHGRPVEILAERILGTGDLTRRLRQAGELAASDVAVLEVASVSPDTPLNEVARLLLTRKIKRLPVVSDGKVVGCISREDLLAAHYGE